MCWDSLHEYSLPQRLCCLLRQKLSQEEQPAVKTAKAFSLTDQLLVNYPEQDEESSDSDIDNDLDDYVYDESSDDDKL